MVRVYFHVIQTDRSGKTKKKTKKNLPSYLAVPKGWGGVGAFHACSHSSKVYTNPEEFDPMRFAAPRLEHQRHEYAFVPQGCPNMLATHGCAGYDMTSVMLKVFLINLLQSYDWELLPKQKLAKNPAGVPALPIDGLKVRFFPLKS